MSTSDETPQYRFNTNTSVLEYHRYGTRVPIRKKLQYHRIGTGTATV